MCMQLPDKATRGGRSLAAMKVKAEVCLHCGERFLKPEHDQTNELKVLGAAFQAASSSDGFTVS